MESLATFLAFSAGLLIRLALPLLATMMAVYFLRKLDTKWQEEAQDELVLQVEQGARIECWKMKNCSQDQREVCPAYSSIFPCWQIRRQPNGYLLEDCLHCDVFTHAPIPMAHAHS